MLNLFTDVQIGTFIPNATANSVLFIDSNGKLAEDNPNFTYSAGTLGIDRIQFDIGATPITNAEGLLQWNATDGTLDLGMSGGDVTMQMGQEMFIKVRNESGYQTISNGQVVYIQSRTGVFPTVQLARSDAEATSAVLGVATQDIASPGFGYITTIGYVRGIKTDYTGTGDWGTTWVMGDTLYVSKTVAGQLTNVEPSVPHHSDIVGSVGIVHATQGSILVKAQKHSTLEGLTDVNGTALTVTGQIPVWDQANSYFDFNYNITDYQLKADFTQGSVLFRGASVITEDNANFFWDDANNRLGIGTNAPAYRLDVLSSDTVVANFGNTGQADQRVYLQNNRAANVLNTTGFNYYMETSTSTRSAYGIIAQFTNITDATRTSRVDFKTADSGVFGTAMSILGTYVGIGTTTPTRRLDIYDATNNAKIAFHTAVTGVGAGDGTTIGPSTNGDFYFWNYENQPMYFATNATTRFYIGASGDIGINETSPAGKLEINTGATTKIGQIIKRVASQTANLSEWRDESDNVLMQVNENGYIGIGIDPSTVPLYIQGTTSADSRIRINSDGQYTGLYTYQYSDTNFHGHFQAHYRYRGSIAVKAAAAANDTILTIEGWAADSAVAAKRAGQFQCKIDSVGAGYVTGQWEWKVSDTSNTVRSKLKIKNSEIVFNEDAQDTNTRIEGATNTNLFFVDAGNDRVGIGTNAPTARLHLLAGTATANTAPLKFTSGTLLTSPEAGAMEFLTDKFYLTQTTGDTRKEIKLVDQYYAEMYEYENVTSTVIGTQNVYHAVNNFSTGDLSGFTFVSGIDGTGTVTDYSGTVAGTVLLTDAAHGLATGDIITVHNSTDYNGTFTITKVDDNSFYFTDTYTSDQSADWAMGSYLLASTGSDGMYETSWDLTAFTGAANLRFKFELNQNTTTLDKTANSRVFSTASDYGVVTGGGFASIAAGDRIWLSTRNETSNQDITIRHGNVRLKRL